MPQQFTGQLKFFRSDRPSGGYGFITRDGGTINDFLHVTALRDSSINIDALEDGKTRFAYDLVADAKNNKMKATNVRILD